MRILTVIYNLEKGGTQRAAQVFAEAYCKLGHESRIVSLYGLGVRYDEIKDMIYVWNKLSSNHLLEIKKWNPDILHIHSHGPKEGDINRLIKNLLNVKIVETNVFSEPSPWAKNVDVSYQLSSWAQWIFDIRGGKKFKSAIIPYPVRCDSFKCASIKDVSKFKKTYNIPNNAFVIGRVGQFFPGKWSPMLLEIFNDLAKIHDNIYLLIVNAPQNILDLVDKSVYRDRIVCIPVIIGDYNLSVAYSSMNTMVLIAEQGESFGMVSAESILCGTPVIALSTPWADNSQCEVVGNGVGGYIANSSVGIKKAISLVINKEQIIDKDEGFQHIYEEYGYIHVAQKALDCIDEIDKENKSYDIIKISINTIDKTNFLTKFLLKTNNRYLRLLTIYTSHYKHWRDFPMSVIKKMMHIVKK